MLPRIAIVGGGIGGLTTALALRRHGFEPVIYEAAPALAPVGAGILVPTNAMLAYERLGLTAPLAAAGVPLDRIELGDVDGTVVQSFDASRLERDFGQRTLAIRRADFVQVLADHLPPDTLRLGMNCTQAAEDTASVTLHFENGQTATADLAIGADGIHSAVRRTVAPAVSLRYARQTCYRGLAALDLGASRRTSREIWGGAVRFGYAAVAEDEVYWFAPITAPAGTHVEPERLPSTLRQRYTGFPDPVGAILHATPAERIIQTDLYDFPPFSGWSSSSGRIVLVGDAAHATTPNLGQGGAQAVEDAIVLADCLARTPGDRRTAVQDFERRRQPKTRWITRTSLRFGAMAHIENRAARWLRNAVLQETPDFVTRRQARRIFSLED